MKSINIGILIYTKIGTKTSILSSEFEFWNQFALNNPDCNFYFVSVSKNTTSSLIKNKDLLNFEAKILNVYTPDDYHKLKNLSGAFTYLLRNTFFGGKMDGPSTLNYAIASYCTNELKIPLFIRMPDSEYPYLDYYKMIQGRIVGEGKSVETFKKINNHIIEKLPKDMIDYSKVYFVSNGMRAMYDWVQDAAHHDVNPSLRVFSSPEEVGKRTLYVSDDLLFNLTPNKAKYKYLKISEPSDRLVFIGYLRGSVSANRVKVFNRMFKNKTVDVPLDIIGPGASELEIKRDDIKLIDATVFGKEFYELLNTSLAYLFIGKGNKINKYVNKTIYDCVAAKCPIVVYRKCDTTHAIFNNDEYYFETHEELLELVDKLKNPKIRTKWIKDQSKEVEEKLETLTEPLFTFNQFCKPKAEIKEYIKTTSLF